MLELSLGGRLQRVEHHALIALALRRVSYRPRGANAVLRDNVGLYGLGGTVVPFVGIDIIDLSLLRCTSRRRGERKRIYGDDDLDATRRDSTRRDATRRDASHDRDLKNSDPDATLPVSMDLVTSSANGIDPEISPEGPYYQAARVAKARHRAFDAVNGVVAEDVHARELGLLGNANRRRDPSGVRAMSPSRRPSCEGRTRL